MDSSYPEGEFLMPLFPLPNLVFFPNTRLPLHVFEPRYRQLIADVLARDQRFGITLLQPGWEAIYWVLTFWCEPMSSQYSYYDRLRR